MKKPGPFSSSVRVRITENELIMRPMTAVATGVRIDEDRLHVELSDGREISAPLDWFPKLLNATREQRSHWKLIGKGIGIH